MFELESLAEIPMVFKPSARRKTLGLKVVQGQVIVSYPPWVAKAEVCQWVSSQSEWIHKHYKPVQPPQKFAEGDEFLWLGERIQLTKTRQADRAVTPAKGPLLPNVFFDLNFSQQKDALLNACATVAADDLPARVAIYQEKLGLYASSVKLRAYKSRWGSCTSRGEVTLNFLLMLAPDWVRDYVVVHELCHLKHLNHSARFWREVERVFDQRRVQLAKQWLRRNGDQMISIYR